MWASARIAPHGPSGMAADGEAPGCCGAIRTRSACGLVRKRSGGSSFTASPSIPAATGPSERTSNDGCGPLLHALLAVSARACSEDRDAEHAGVQARAGARRERAAEPVRVVGDEHDRAGLVLATVGAGPAQVERVSARAEHRRHRLGDRSELRVAVPLALDRFGVDAERDVVHEHAAVDLGEVHHPLAPFRERVERSRRRRRGRRRDRARNGYASRPARRHTGVPVRRRSRRRSPACRRRRPRLPRPRRCRSRRAPASRGRRRGAARPAPRRARAPRARHGTAPPCRRPISGCRTTPRCFGGVAAGSFACDGEHPARGSRPRARAPPGSTRPRARGPRARPARPRRPSGHARTRRSGAHAGRPVNQRPPCRQDKASTTHASTVRPRGNRCTPTTTAKTTDAANSRSDAIAASRRFTHVSSNPPRRSHGPSSFNTGCQAGHGKTTSRGPIV